MNKYLATVRVKGKSVRTMVYAESSLHARLILEFQFGIGNVMKTPTLTVHGYEDYKSLDEVIKTIKPLKPLSPEQAKLDSLKKQKDIASRNLKAEKDRQKVARAHQHIRKASANNYIAQFKN